MKGVIRLSELKELLRSDKAVRIAVAAGAVLILLLAFGSVFFAGGKSADSSSGQLREYETALEKRLEKILSEINGVGNVKVMITLDTEQQTEYGKSANMITSVTAPTVRGVIVVCDGGDSINVKEKVINAVTGVFGISSKRVSVSS